MKKNVFADLPTYHIFFSDRYRKQTIFFSWPYEVMILSNMYKYQFQCRTLNVNDGHY